MGEVVQTAEGATQPQRDLQPAAKIPSEHLLKQFVDRREALAWFCRLLDGLQPGQRSMWLHGPSGSGKSVLLSRMMLECRQRGIRWLHAEWRETKRYSYLDLMRRLRDSAMRRELFELFNDQVNRFTKADYDMKIKLDMGDIQNVRVLEDGRLEGASGAQIQIGNHIDDLQINIIRPDYHVDDRHVRIELTRAFVPCLEALARDGMVVLFLDALEKADEGTVAWIAEEVLERITLGELANVLLVLAGQQPPTDVDRQRFDSCLRAWALKPLAQPDVEELLLRKNFNPVAAKTLAMFMVANANLRPPTPFEVVMQAMNYEMLVQGESPGG